VLKLSTLFWDKILIILKMILHFWDLSGILHITTGGIIMSERISRIRQLIEESGKTYQELEELTGIKKSSLQRYVSGVTEKIPLSAIESLANTFNISPAYLMGWEDGREERKEKALTADSEHTSDLSPAFFRLKQGLEPYGISDSDVDFLLDVYKAHIKNNQ